MKKIYLFLIAILLASHIIYAQNTFPTPSGNVGIGTTSPNEVLDVMGFVGAFSSTAKATAVFEQDHTNYRGIYLGYDSSGQIGIIAGNTNTTPSNIAFWNYSGTNWFEAMRLTSSGYLGIGTTTPRANLHVPGTAILGGGNLDPNYAVNNLSYLTNTGQMLIGWNRTAGAGETDFIGNQGAGAPGGFAFYNHDNNNNETQLMWILGNGNVLIGKPSQANPIYKLDVKGYVRADQIVVNTSGADFVFDPVYKLHSLSFIKKYIDQNHHLPEMASAKQMQVNGLNLGDNQIKLLQKVEELTLYTIASDKEIKNEKAVVAQQQTQLTAQQKQIDRLNEQVQALIKALKK